MSADGGPIDDLARRLCNTGRWGADDERGTLNYISPESVVTASRLVRTGRIVSASHDVNFSVTARNPRPGLHQMLYREDRASLADAVTLQCHGYAMTHIDALGHVTLDGRTYNDRKFDDVVSRDGLSFASVLPLAAGIATRGVLLDIPRSRQEQWLPRDATVSAADLEAAEAVAGVSVTQGDALVVRIGLDAREAATGPMANDERTGLGPDCIEWLYDRKVAVFGGDCVERLPSGIPEWGHPLHSVGIARMGLVLVDNIAVEALAQACEEEERWEFFFVVAPLRIPRATGSAVNPLCLF
jgi:kynurenine formamidase